MRKISPLRLKKYDTTQKILEVLANAESRVILFNIVRSAKTVSEIAIKHNIPQSTVYKKIKEMEDLSLIKVENVMIADSGRKFKIYRSNIKQAIITVKNQEPNLKILPN